MTKVEAGRHCAKCDLTVHDLSSMSETEVRALMARKSTSRLCIRYQPRNDGTIRTAHEKVIPPSRLLAKAKPAMLAVGTMLASACGPAIDSLPTAARDAIPYAVDAALRHPLEFTECLVRPDCDPFLPPAVAGGG